MSQIISKTTFSTKFDDVTLNDTKNTLCYILRHNHNMNKRYGFMDSEGFMDLESLALLIHDKMLNIPIDNIMERIKQTVEKYYFIFTIKENKIPSTYHRSKIYIKCKTGHTNDIKMKMIALQYKKFFTIDNPKILYATSHSKNIKNIEKFGLKPTHFGHVFVRLFSDYTKAVIYAKEMYGPQHCIYICLVEAYLDNHPDRTKYNFMKYPLLYMKADDYRNKKTDIFYTTKVFPSDIKLFEGDLVYKFV